MPYLITSRGPVDRPDFINYSPTAFAAFAWNDGGDRNTRFYRKTRPLDGRAATASRRDQAPDRDRQHQAGATGLGGPAWSVTREGGDRTHLRGRAGRWLQHQRRDQHARLRQ